MTVNTLTYRNYTHDENSVIVRSISKRKERSARGWSTITTESWTFDFVLLGETEAELTTKIAAVEAAYSVDGGNLTWGTTQHKLLNTGTMGGTSVVSLEWSNQFPSEYVNVRSGSITVHAQWQVVENEILEFEEALSSSGGLPQYVIQTVRNGLPIVQQTSPATPYQASQRGFVLGATRYQPASSPIFGSTSPPLLNKEVSLDTPQYFRGYRFAFRTSWSYQFLATFPMFGYPTNR